MRRFCWALAVALACAGPLDAARQTSSGEAGPAFEVASVKANVSGTVVLPDGRVATGTNVGSAGGRLTAENASLHTLVSMAYGIQEFRISGGPRWMRTSRFNVEAKAPSAVDERVMMLMLRSLLADRFAVVLHHEVKETPAHVLLLARNGPKPQPASLPDPRPIRIGLSGSLASPESPRFQLRGIASMEQLAAFIATVMRSPVVDATGLTGLFDINIEFASETFGKKLKGGERDASIGVAAPLDAPDAELADALQTQMGLRLETQRRPIETLVIDSASLPSAN